MKLDKNTPLLLVVDDDTRIRTLLQKYLIEQGYFVSTVKDAFEAEKIIKEIKFNLIILDLMMPGKTGIEFTKELRKTEKSYTPIIMLTAMGELNDRITGLEIGADDYLAKPFEPKELLLRISNILKRHQAHKPNIFQFSDFSYNLNTESLSKQEQSIFLTKSEQVLLSFLIKNANQIIPREELAKQLNINERSVDVQIVRLRNKIESNSSRPQFLQTMRNQGYILRV